MTLRSVFNNECILTSLSYKTDRFYVPVHTITNRSQMTSKCGKNISDTHLSALVLLFLFLPQLNVIFDLLLNRCTATWNLLVNLSNNIQVVSIHVCTMHRCNIIEFSCSQGLISLVHIRTHAGSLTKHCLYG